MSLRIRFRGGDLAGQVFTFADDVERIVVGRDPERCDVVLPATMTQVGREHLALRRELARYRLVLNRENPVFLDDEPALDDTELPEVAYVRLGVDGPQMVVQTLGSTLVPPTEHHGEVGPDLQEIVRETARRSRRNWTFSAATGLLLLLLVGGVVWLVGQAGKTTRSVEEVRQEQARVRGLIDEDSRGFREMVREYRESTADLRERLGNVDEAIQEFMPDLSGLRETVAGLGPRMEGLEERIRVQGARINQRLARLSGSVHVVLIRDARGVEHALATAWAVSRGTLATNAHVAEFFDRLTPGSTMLVRSPGANPTDHDIVGVDIHPGYGVFLALWTEYRPTGMSPEGRLHSLRPAGIACDVALLQVNGADTLAAPLSIAPAETLAALQAGDVVGLMGYPSEEMSLGGVNLARPTPTTQIAHVTSVTNFFLAASEPEDSLLVQHSLPVTGGASGSPIINESGEVIAVLSAGNISLDPLTSERAPSAVLVNFAQRADLVRELLDGRADEIQTARTKRWRQGIQTLMSLRAAAERGATGFLDRYLAVLERASGKTRARLEDEADALGDPHGGTPWLGRRDRLYDIPEAGVYVFFAWGLLGQDVNLAVLDPADDTIVHGREASADWYAGVRIEADGAAQVRLRLSGPRDAEYRLQVWRLED